MIEVKSLTKSFGNKIAVNNTTWTAKSGHITGFIGQNGAGKTTTLSILTGSLRPTSGTVLLDGIDIETSPLETKKKFGYVSDSPDHFLRLKAREYLDFIADIYEVSIEKRNEFIENFASRFGLSDSLDQPILSFSHGMRQKLIIMGALIHDPDIWILDEPLTGLDPESAYELKEIMKSHAKKGKTVLFSTHVLEVAEKLCDEVIIIKKGTILFSGTLSSLKSRYPDSSLEDIFLKINKTPETPAKTLQKGSKNAKN